MVIPNETIAQFVLEVIALADDLKEVLGRILGPARGEGNEMVQWVLEPNGRVVPWRTSRPLNTAEINSETENKKREIFDALIKGKLGTSSNAPKDELQDFEAYEDEDDKPVTIPENEDATDANVRLLNQQPAYDKIINAEVQLPQG